MIEECGNMKQNDNNWNKTGAKRKAANEKRKSLDITSPSMMEEFGNNKHNDNN